MAMASHLLNALALTQVKASCGARSTLVKLENNTNDRPKNGASLF